MDVQDALLGRRTAHGYQPNRPLPEGVLDAALSAAHHAPCHRHTWPWRFAVVGPDTRARLAEVAVAAKEAKRPLSEEGRAGVRAGVTNPSALVVVSQVLAESAEVREEDYAATACAIQNLQLSLHGHGVASKWSTGGVTRHPDTYALLGIDPSRERIVGFVWAGYPAAPFPEVRRPPLEAHVRRAP